MTKEIDLDGSRLTLKSRDSQFAEISEIHQQLEPADEDRVTQMMRIYTRALGRLVSTHLDPTTEQAQEWLDELDHRAIGIAFSDEYEMEPSQFLENWYSKCVKEIAKEFHAPEKEKAGLWLDEIDSRFQSLVELRKDDFNISELYANVYSMVVTSIIEVYAEPESAAATRWIGLIEEMTVRAATEKLTNADPVQFLENFFANSFVSLIKYYGTNREAAAWFSKLQKRADEMASDTIIKDSNNFLINTYSMSLSKLTQPSKNRSPDGEQMQSWFTTLEDGLHSTAVSDHHNSEPGGYLVNIYSQATTRLTEHRQSPRDSETAAWLDQFEWMVEDRSTDPLHQMTAGDFLANYYAFTLERILDEHSDTEQASRWLDELAYRTVDAGLNSQLDHSPGEFAGYVFLITRMNVAKDGETLEAGCEEKRVLLLGSYLANSVSGDIHDYLSMARKVHQLYTVDSTRAIKGDVLAAVSAVDQAEHIICTQRELINNAAAFVAAGLVHLYDQNAFSAQFADQVVSHIEHTLADQALVDEFFGAITRAIEEHDGGWKVRPEWPESTDMG